MLETADHFLQLTNLVNSPGAWQAFSPSQQVVSERTFSFFLLLLWPPARTFKSNKIKMMAVLLACSLCFFQCPKLFLARCKHLVNPCWMKTWTRWLHWTLSPALVLTFDLVYSGRTVCPYHKTLPVSSLRFLRPKRWWMVDDYLV